MKKKLVLMTSALMAISLLAGCGQEAHSHEYKLVDEVAATCTESGVHAHYTCGGCDKLFDEGKNETTLEALTIAALGHDYQFGSFVWADDYTAQAKYVCSRDADHVEMHDATVASEVTTEPGCETEGVRTYTASYDGHSDAKTAAIPAKGHSWGEPTYVWAEDNSTCTATVICGNDSTHKIEETVECTFAELEAATEEADGKGKYTATFENKAFATQTVTGVIPSLPTLSKLTFEANENNGYTVSALNTEIAGRVTIPATYKASEEGEELPVNAIKERGFYNCGNITYVNIPGSITAVGTDLAFASCHNLETVIFNEGTLELGRRAFHSDDAIKSIYIPASITTTGRQGFQGCSALESITFAEESNLTTIANATFSNCSSLKEIHIPGKVTVLDSNCMTRCTALEKVTIPVSVTSIMGYPFNECSALHELFYEGTKEQWSAINLHALWNGDEKIIETVHCTDGDITL